MNKKLLGGVALVLSSGLILSGCATGSTDAGGDNGSGECEGAVAMSFASPSAIPIWAEQLEVMKPIIEAAGCEFLSDDSNFTADVQVTNWQNWIARGDVKAIMGYPTASDDLVVVTEEATAAGIPVLGYVIKWEGVEAGLVIDNYNDGYTLGEAAGKQIIEQYGTDSVVQVALHGWRDNDLGRERTEGIMKALGDSGANIEVTEHKVATLEDGYSAAENQLTAHPDTKVWISFDNDTTLGAYQAVLDSGVAADDPNFLFAGLDATNETLNIMTTPGSFWKFSSFLSAKVLGETNAQLLLAAATGKPVKDISVASEPVNSENAASFIS